METIRKELSSIEQLDLVFDYIYEQKAVSTQKIKDEFKDIFLSDSYIYEILHKFNVDEHTYTNHDIISTTWKGRYFKETEISYKNQDLRKKAEHERLKKIEQTQKRINIFLIIGSTIAAVGTIGLLIMEIVKYLTPVRYSLHY